MAFYVQQYRVKIFGCNLLVGQGFVCNFADNENETYISAFMPLRSVGIVGAKRFGAHGSRQARRWNLQDSPRKRLRSGGGAHRLKG